MTPMVTAALPPLDRAAMKYLASGSGPAITISIPDHHPGAREASPSVALRSLIKQVEATKLASAAALMGRLEEAANEPGWDKGGQGSTLFCCPDFTARFATPGVTNASQTIASHFQLRPLLATAFAPQEFFILALSRKRLRLLEFNRGTCRELDLPEGVPTSVEEAVQIDLVGQDTRSRAPSGPSTGSMSALQFGNTADREAAGEYLHQFFLQVDRGLKATLADKPLLLIGVHEQIAAYRRAARYDQLLDAEIDGNVDPVPPAEIAQKAASAALQSWYALGETVLKAYESKPDRTRTLADLQKIITAAAQGRVHQLCVRVGAQVPGPIPKDLDRAGLEKEDLVNVAIVETLRHGGEVYELPQDRMPESQPAAAILRY